MLYVDPYFRKDDNILFYTGAGKQRPYNVYVYLLYGQVTTCPYNSILCG